MIISLRTRAILVALGAGLAAAVPVARVYVALPAVLSASLLALGALTFLGATTAYLLARRAAIAWVWPKP